MSENNLTCRDENTEAVKVIKETVKDLVGRGIIHSRDDIIRHLCGANFDITGGRRTVLRFARRMNRTIPSP